MKVKFRGKLVGQFGNRSFAPFALEQEKNAMSESISINQIVNSVIEKKIFENYHSSEKKESIVFSWKKSGQ